MTGALKKCGHCGVIEGRMRPIGRYIVELHSFDFDGDHLELCITCYKHYKRKVTQLSIEEKEKGVGFYSNIVKFYKNTFRLVKQNE